MLESVLSQGICDLFDRTYSLPAQRSSWEVSKVIVETGVGSAWTTGGGNGMRVTYQE